MKKMVQIMPACEGWEAVFFSYDGGECFRESIVCWAFISARPYVENGDGEERYIEGRLVLNGGSRIAGVTETPEGIGFLGYLYSKLPEETIKERMDYFRDQGRDLMELKRTGRLPED